MTDPEKSFERYFAPIKERADRIDVDLVKVYSDPRPPYLSTWYIKDGDEVLFTGQLIGVDGFIQGMIAQAERGYAPEEFADMAIA